MKSYITFSVGQLQFLDSMQFANASLEKLVSILSHEELVYTKESFNNANQFDLVQQKGVYPYDYMVNFDRFSDTQLPPKDRFFTNCILYTLVIVSMNMLSVYGMNSNVKL